MDTCAATYRTLYFQSFLRSFSDSRPKLALLPLAREQILYGPRKHGENVFTNCNALEIRDLAALAHRPIDFNGTPTGSTYSTSISRVLW